uniref:Uncharacterized protein n=1 Tax=Rhizophora mucronata TaxID=61149 RepID=A0A2P2PG43_RHIMU
MCTLRFAKQSGINTNTISIEVKLNPPKLIFHCLTAENSRTEDNFCKSSEKKKK